MLFRSSHGGSGWRGSREGGCGAGPWAAEARGGSPYVESTTLAGLGSLRLKLFNRSQTYRQLRELLRFLPSQRRRELRLLIPVSIIPGLIDLLSVAVIARLMGALVGNHLEDRLPGVKVFGGNSVDQSL